MVISSRDDDAHNKQSPTLVGRLDNGERDDSRIAAGTSIQVFDTRCCWNSWTRTLEYAYNELANGLDGHPREARGQIQR